MKKIHLSANTSTDFVMSVVFLYDMKTTSPYLHHRFLILAALAAALPLANSANAQNPAAPAATATSKTASSTLQSADYDNASFADVVEHLRIRSGLNIVVQPSLAERVVPRMKVKDASALCILYALAGDLNAKIVELRASEKGGAVTYQVVGQDQPGEAFNLAPTDSIYHTLQFVSTFEQEKARAGIKILPSVEINGITFSVLIDFLNLKTDANFFLGAELGAVKVPALKMQNVSSIDVISVVSRLLNIPVETRWITSGEKGSKDIYWVKKFAVPQPDKNAKAAPITKKTRVYNLRGMEIDGEKDLDKIVKALSEVMVNGVYKERRNSNRIGLDMPELDLHKATKLLFVTAREDDFNILEQIITALGGKTEGAVATPASETVKGQP